MFIDPKELALGVSEPVIDTNTALAAKRRLGTMYKSITHAVRHEAALMSAVFARPMEAITAFVHRLFEQRIQVALSRQPLPTLASSEKTLWWAASVIACVQLLLSMWHEHTSANLSRSPC